MQNCKVFNNLDGRNCFKKDEEAWENYMRGEGGVRREGTKRDETLENGKSYENEDIDLININFPPADC